MVQEDTCRRFKFPKTMTCPSLSTFLGPDSDTEVSASGEEPPSVQRNLDNAFRQISNFGLNPNKAAESDVTFAKI